MIILDYYVTYWFFSIIAYLFLIFIQKKSIEKEYTREKHFDLKLLKLFSIFTLIFLFITFYYDNKFVTNEDFNKIVQVKLKSYDNNECLRKLKFVEELRQFKLSQLIFKCIN